MDSDQSVLKVKLTRAGSNWRAYYTGAYYTVSYRIIPQVVKTPRIIGIIVHTEFATGIATLNLLLLL
jgi:hypothetical protein